MSPELSHIDEHGRASMVDVTNKATTYRQAWARCRVPGAASSSRAVLEAAQVAGMEGAKSTSRLIPLCHPLPLTDIAVEFATDGTDLVVFGRAETVAQTGVEMEALTACAMAALTIVASLIAEDPGVTVEELTLWEKRGGRSGVWLREGAEPEVD